MQTNNLKINIMLEDDKNYFWQNKKDGILLNDFMNKADRGYYVNRN